MNDPQSFLKRFAPQMLVIIGGLLLFLGNGGAINIPSIVPEPDSGFKLDGMAVMVQIDNKEVETYSPKQAGIRSSLILREWADKNCMPLPNGLRVASVEEDLSKEAAHWQQMRSAITLKPPSVIVVDGKRVMQSEIKPEDGAEEMVAAIDKWRNK